MTILRLSTHIPCPQSEPTTITPDIQALLNRLPPSVIDHLRKIENSNISASSASFPPPSTTPCHTLLHHLSVMARLINIVSISSYNTMRIPRTHKSNITMIGLTYNRTMALQFPKMMVTTTINKADIRTMDTRTLAWEVNM